MKLRKGWGVLGLLMLSLALFDLCEAAIEGGQCSICHTMHNSEEGLAVAFTLNPTSGAKVASELPFGNLLKTQCVGCHSNVSADTIVEFGDLDIPIVFNIAEPAYPPVGTSISTLAGGNFHWMIENGDAYGHNVFGISDQDSRFSLDPVPGGVVRSAPECANSCHSTLATAQTGCEGCHVVEHHSGSTNRLAGMDDGWYRFLGSVMQRADGLEPSQEGVVGIESPDWEQDPSLSHNTYQGAPLPFTNYLASGSIDQKCTGCHGGFHTETVADATWIRHPVSVAIPDSGEFVNMTTYDPLAPVSRQNLSLLDVDFSDINRGSDMVSCISCHRPHGSPYPAMMRWGYRDWPGTDAHTDEPAVNGCAVCHTSKS